MVLKFIKMHGLGNDFVVVDAIHQTVRLSPAQVRFLADRRRGIGCDQVLLVEAPRTTATDFYYRIFNADGGEVEQCGNGARCFALFVHNQGLTDKRTLRVGTLAGSVELRLEADGQISVDMGRPRFAPADIPFIAEAQADTYTLEVDGEQLTLGAVSLGNPHAVCRVEDVQTAPVTRLGPRIERHRRFPQRVNAGFMEIVARDHIRLRVYERGAGETQACGTGACAAVAVGRQQGLLDAIVDVDLPGGRLSVQWDGNGRNVRMTGPATEVFEGQIEL